MAEDELLFDAAGDAARASVNVNLSSHLLSRLAFKVGAPRSLTVHRVVDLSSSVSVLPHAHKPISSTHRQAL